jgi:DNA-binding CsgD family transcriptional regulator
MAVKIQSAEALTQLTPAEKRVAERLVAGASNIQGAQELGMSTTTFAGHVASIGRKFQITSRSGRAARAHAVLASKQIAPPSAPAQAPRLTAADLRLLRAIAKYPETPDIALAAGIAQADVRSQIKNLVAEVGADNETHLIGLAHAWGLLGPSRNTTSDDTTGAASEPAGAAQ